MKKDKEKTDVIFRVDITKQFKGDVMAIFPYIVENTKGDVRLYVHVGQHFSGDYNICIQTSRLATKKEAKYLKAELEQGFGYNLNVVKKRNYKRYLKSFLQTVDKTF